MELGEDVVNVVFAAVSGSPVAPGVASFVVFDVDVVGDVVLKDFRPLPMSKTRADR